MANTSTTIAQAEVMIRQRITDNNSKAITGQVLQDVLLGITSGVKVKTEENSKNITVKVEELRGEINYELQNITSYVSGSTKTAADNLSNEIIRAQQAEQSLYNTYSAITSEHLSGITNARAILLSDETMQVFTNASNVDDALKYSAPDDTLTIPGRSAEANTTGNRISSLEGKLNNYTFASAMTEDDYVGLASKDNNTIYFLTED